MDAHGSHVIHPGGAPPGEPARRRIARWLEANGVDPASVPQEDPLLVLSLPERRRGRTSDTWRVLVIVVNQYVMAAKGRPEVNHLTGQPIKYQRTIPLKVPYEAESSTP